MKRARILALLTDELESMKDPKHEPLPGAVGLILGSLARDVLTLERRDMSEISATSNAAMTRQAARYRRNFNTEGKNE